MNDNVTQTSMFGTEKIYKILLQLAPPVMFAQLIQALYNIVDQIFIVNASYLVHTATPQIRLFSRLPLLRLGLRL